MIFRSLKMAGFKSFPESVELDIDRALQALSGLMAAASLM